VEYYPWNVGSHACSEMPFTDVVFGLPTSTSTKKGEAGSNGMLMGTLSNAYEYGDCVGKVDFRTLKVKAGQSVDVGL
jgi:hypothetical protein